MFSLARLFRRSTNFTRRVGKATRSLATTAVKKTERAAESLVSKRKSKRHSHRRHRKTRRHH